MALIVENGTGLADAESYISVADADAYHAKYGTTQTWTDADTATREAALRHATRAIDNKYRLRWKGLPTRTTPAPAQALAWPRYGADDANGLAIGSAALPQVLIDATAVLAAKHVEGTDLVPDVKEPGAIKSKSVKLGSLAKTVEFAGSGSQEKSFTLVERLLRGLLEPGMRLYRV